MRPVWMALSFVSFLAAMALARNAMAKNLQLCLSGRYPALCDHRILTSEQRLQTRAAEARENLRVCMTGRYPALCDQSMLTSDQAQAVRSAEANENLRICITGKYPALCNHGLLSAG